MFKRVICLLHLLLSFSCPTVRPFDKPDDGKLSRPKGTSTPTLSLHLYSHEHNVTICSDFSEPLAVTLGFFFASLSILHCAFGTILAGCPLKESNNRTKLSPFNCPQFLDNHQCEVIKYCNSDYFVALSSLMQFSNISVFAKRSLSSADTFVSKLKSLCATLLYLNDLFIMDN